MAIRIPVTMIDMPVVSRVERILRDTWRHYKRVGTLNRKDCWVNVRLVVERSGEWYVDLTTVEPPEGAFTAAGIIPYGKFSARDTARALIATCADQALKLEKEPVHAE